MKSGMNEEGSTHSRTRRVSEVEPLWAHQSLCIREILEKKTYGVFFDMGCGKTRTAIEAAREARCRKILVVCPHAVVPVWYEQFEEWWPGYEQHVDLTVINYEKVWRRKDIYVRKSKKDPQDIAVQEWDMVISDEAHRLKTHSSVQSKALWKIGLKSEYRLALTGTPLPHSPSDAFALMRFVREEIFGKFITPFRERYEVRFQVPGQTYHIVKGHKNLDELKAKMSEWSMVVKSEDVLELPEWEDREILCQLPPKAMRVHEEVKHHLIAEIEEAGGHVVIDNALVKLLRLQQLTSGFIPVGEEDDKQLVEVHDAKIKAIAQIVSDIYEPVVVFCQFRQELDNVKAIADKAKRGYYELSGRVKQIDEWKADSTGIIAVQIKAGGSGVDLTHSRVAVYYSTGFNMGDYWQSRKRIHRPGQGRRCTYYHMVARDTIDEYVVEAMKAKEDVVNEVVEGIRGAKKASNKDQCA